jgi:hydroxymethylpyrimidine/phosphomethylpyrimidine kinase
LMERLVPLAEVVTPNVDEASVMTGLAVANADQMRTAAVRLHSLGAANLVITGGHLPRATDLLSSTTDGQPQQVIFEAERLVSNSTHGTGCAFSTALACRLALGAELVDAVRLAKEYVSAAIANAYPVGRGVGPMHHLFRGLRVPSEKAD